MANVRLEYLYRDADNSKAYMTGPLIMAGPATEAELEQLRATLDAGEFFICEQVGLPALEFEPEVAAFGDPEADHPWHTLRALELTDAAPTTEVTFAEMLQRFLDVDRWDESLGRQVDDGFGIPGLS